MDNRPGAPGFLILLTESILSFYFVFFLQISTLIQKNAVFVLSGGKQGNREGGEVGLGQRLCGCSVVGREGARLG